MRFEQVTPSDFLKPYVKHFAISESETANTYKVFPTTGLVIGFQYRGSLVSLANDKVVPLASSGITGLADSFKIFKNSPNIGTILVYFTETGFAHFSQSPVHELFNQSISLECLFEKSSIQEVEDKITEASTDAHRIHIVELFLAAHLKRMEADKLIIEAVKLIYASKGTIKIHELNDRLCISPSPFEKRFRKLVGTTPKKFASIVRFNAVISELNKSKSLSEICYDNHFFDQAHFSKDFKQYTGETPENFKRNM